MSLPETLLALLRYGATVRLGDPRFPALYKTASMARRIRAAGEKIVVRNGCCWLERVQAEARL